MVQIINKPGFAELLGQNLGTGLSKGLESGTSNALNLLVNQRVNEIAQRNLQQRLQSGLQPLFPEQAEAYSQLPSELLKPLLQEATKSKANVSQSAPGLQTIIPELSESQASKVASLTPGLQLEFYRSYLRNPEAMDALLENISPSPVAPGAQPKAIKTPEQKLDTQLQKMALKPQIKEPEKAPVIPQIPQQELQQPEPQPPKLENPKTSKQIDKNYFNQAKDLLEERKEPQEAKPEPRSYAERAKQAREEKEAQKESQKQRAAAHKEGIKIYNEINKAARGAKEDLIRLDEIMDLNENGNLGIPAVNSFIKTVGKGIFGHGIDLTYLMTADAQKLDKLSNDFVRNAKDYFGSRVTDLDLKTYVSTLPNLMQTRDGRREVIRNMRIFLDAKTLRQKAAQQILKANNNQFPDNYDGLIDEIAGPELDRLAAEYKASPMFMRPPKSLGRTVAEAFGLVY